MGNAEYMGIASGCLLWVVELFPVHVRGTGVSVAYNIGIGIFGGAGPLISDASKGFLPPNGLVSAPAAYTMVTGLISLFAMAAGHVMAKNGMMKLTHIRESPY